MHTTTTKNNSLLAATILIIAAGATRFITIPGIGFAQNFTAMGGLAIFSASFFKPVWKSILVTFLAFIITDVFLNKFVYAKYNLNAVSTGAFVKYGAMTLVVLAGYFLIKKPNLLNIISSSLVGSILFFIVTNFAVWYATPANAVGAFAYSNNFAGLAACYIAGIPFLINFTVSTILSAGIMFYIYQGATLRKPLAIV